jgi:hypothetical protein
MKRLFVVWLSMSVVIAIEWGLANHSNLDTFDRVQGDDMIQQATVIAVLAYNAAMRDSRLPGKSEQCQ